MGPTASTLGDGWPWSRGRESDGGRPKQGSTMRELLMHLQAQGPLPAAVAEGPYLPPSSLDRDRQFSPRPMPLLKLQLPLLVADPSATVDKRLAPPTGPLYVKARPHTLMTPSRGPSPPRPSCAPELPPCRMPVTAGGTEGVATWPFPP